MCVIKDSSEFSSYAIGSSYLRGVSIYRILFICMGNICRSPLAEGLLLHHLKDRPFEHLVEVDSAGTGGWHEGSPPDQRSIEVARLHGIALNSRARKVERSDFTSFDILICMDDQNLRELVDMGCPLERVRTMMSYASAPAHDHVPDPYYGDVDGFELMYRLLDSAVLGLIESIGSNLESGSS